MIDPKTLTVPNAVLGAFDPATNTGVIALHACGPNGATVGPNDNILLGCTPQNNPSNVIQLVINDALVEEHLVGPGDVGDGG